VSTDNPVPEYPVAESSVRDLDADRVAHLHPLDVGERCEVGGAVAGDVDQLALTPACTFGGRGRDLS
jgi:hypothetical protein